MKLHARRTSAAWIRIGGVYALRRLFLMTNGRSMCRSRTPESAYWPWGPRGESKASPYAHQGVQCAACFKSDTASEGLRVSRPSDSLMRRGPHKKM